MEQVKQFSLANAIGFLFGQPEQLSTERVRLLVTAIVHTVLTPVMTALLAACQEGSAGDVVSLIKERGGDPNLPLGPGGGGPLHHAVGGGHAHLVTLLLSHPDIDPNIVNSEGMTPVHLAASQGRDKIVRLMGKNLKHS